MQIGRASQCRFLGPDCVERQSIVNTRVQKWMKESRCRENAFKVSQAAGRRAFEVKFLVRLPPASKIGMRPSVSPFPASSRQDSPITARAFQGESSTHGNSSNPDASGDDHQ